MGMINKRKVFVNMKFYRKYRWVLEADHKEATVLKMVQLK